MERSANVMFPLTGHSESISVTLSKKHRYFKITPRRAFSAVFALLGVYSILNFLIGFIHSKNIGGKLEISQFESLPFWTLFIWFALRSEIMNYKKETRIAKSGATTAALATGSFKDKTQFNERCICYTFQDIHGRRFDGEANDSKATVSEGDMIQVVYESEDPDNNKPTYALEYFSLM